MKSIVASRRMDNFEKRLADLQKEFGVFKTEVTPEKVKPSKKEVKSKK